jgi:hypothetical protein
MFDCGILPVVTLKDASEPARHRGKGIRAGR